MASSPHSPRHSRNSSTMDSQPSSPQARRLSKASTYDPSTSYRNSFNQADAMDLSTLGGGDTGGGNGLGNLADELADAFSDSGEEDDYNEDDPDAEEKGFPGGRNHRSDDGAAKTGPKDNQTANQELLSPPRRGHQRQTSDYDGSEYGSESDLEAVGMPAILVARLDAVESLVRRGTESYGGPADDVVQRVTAGLRDLGSQSSVEASASRLITAHSALTTHLSHQTRQLHKLTFPLLSPLAPPLDAETIDDLIPLLVSLSDSMPRPSTSAFNSLTALHSLTSDLVQTLNYLSDTLHMSRQTETEASRKLKMAKEVVASMKKNAELREEGERWLTRGNWGERLEKRECAGVCGDVIGGFEEVCNGWRERLLAQAESQA